MRENGVLLVQFLVLSTTKDSRDTTHLQLSTFLQLLDLAMQVPLPKHWASVSPGDVGMGLRVVRSFFGNHIMKQTADRFASENMSLVECWNHDWNLTIWYQCAWCLSCPNLCVPKSRVWDANVGRQGPRSPHRLREGAPVHYQLHLSRRMPSGNSRLVSQQDSNASYNASPPTTTTAKWNKWVEKIIPHHPFILSEFLADRHVH